METVKSKASLLSRWESADDPLSPLSSAQIDSISYLEHVSRGSFLEKITQDGSELSDNKKDTEISNISISTSKFPKVCETIQQFLEGLAEIENDLQYNQDSVYREHISKLQENNREVFNLLNEVDKTLEVLRLLEDQYHDADGKSHPLHIACEAMMSEQQSLSLRCENIVSFLEYFSQADVIERRLTNSNLNAKDGTTDILSFLDKIDAGSQFMESHPKFRDSAIYLIKYRACLFKALTLIRSFVVSTIDGAVSLDSNPSLVTPSNLDMSNYYTRQYIKFRRVAPRLNELICAIQKRCDESMSQNVVFIEEYNGLLSDILSAYISTRSAQLLPWFREEILSLGTKLRSEDHCGVVRSGCALLLQTCENEEKLYSYFFSEQTEMFSQFLDGLCQVLYDTIRPLIIHSIHLETLSELTEILSSYLETSHSNFLKSFQNCVVQIKQDVQERLFYRANVYIQTDILGYVPSTGDLAYPQKLELMESIAKDISSAQTSNTANLHTGCSATDIHGMWYPPIRRTLSCLSKLSRCLESHIFNSLARDILSACVTALSDASAEIFRISKSFIDARLFEIKHLLILREQIAPFQANFSITETHLDFSGLVDAATNLMSKSRTDFLSMNSNNALVEFLFQGSPQIVESSKDSKKEVDQRLKFVCQKFIDGVVHLVVGDIIRFVNRAEEFVHNSMIDKGSLRQQSWADFAVLRQIVQDATKRLKKYFVQVQRSLQLYLANKETEFIILRPIRNNIISSFVSFLGIIERPGDYSEEELRIIGCPSQQHLSVLISSLQLEEPENSTIISQKEDTYIE